MFLILPVGVQYNARRYPVVTFTLMGVNVAFYLVSLVQFFIYLEGSPEQQEWMVFNLGLVPAENVWWTYLTSMFVHGGFFHLLGNMMYLFLFGSCLEDKIGRWQFILFYLVMGIVADMAYIAVTPGGEESMIPMVGASGAISGCIGGFVLLLARTKIDFRYFALLFFQFFNGEFSLPAWLVISFWFLSDLFWAVMDLNVSGGNGSVAFAAHVGGTIAGAAAIALWKLVPSIHPRNETEEEESVLQRVYVNVSSDPRTQEVASIYIYHDKNQLGPFTESQMSQMLALGSISPSASYWQEGMDEWRNISEFSRF
jgi:membrane associated rhomboid family serine protease